MSVGTSCQEVMLHVGYGYVVCRSLTLQCIMFFTSRRRNRPEVKCSQTKTLEQQQTVRINLLLNPLVSCHTYRLIFLCFMMWGSYFADLNRLLTILGQDWGAFSFYWSYFERPKRKLRCTVDGVRLRLRRCWVSVQTPPPLSAQRGSAATRQKMRVAAFCAVSLLWFFFNLRETNCVRAENWRWTTLRVRGKLRTDWAPG